MANKTLTKDTKNKVGISRKEYSRLKSLDKEFGKFLRFAQHARDILDARKEIKAKKGTSQDQLFKKLGI